MNTSGEIRQEVLKLMQQKDRIEDEIKELTSILTKNGVGMNDPLVDEQGFPSNTIDIYQVRHARHRIICLQNDHKYLMKQIENGLYGYYSNAANETRISGGTQDVPMPYNETVVVHKTPFAKITIVSPGSPAQYSGFEVDDMVVEFGSLNATNFKNIYDVAAVVNHSENQQVKVKLQRGARYIVTHLIPKKWEGRGLLGCNIVPING